jgi:ribose transport system permease protein
MAFLHLFRRYGVFFILAALVVVFTAVNPVFFSAGNLVNLCKQMAIMGILSVGMTLVLLTGGIELSMGAVVSLLCVTVSMYVTKLGMPAPLAMLMGVGAATLIGFLNGVFIAKIKVPPLIMTLGMQIFLSGLTYTLCGGLPVYGLPNSLKFIAKTQIGGMPLSAIIMFVILAIGIFVLGKTYFGRYLYAVGSNEEATTLSGINTDRIRILAYTLCGAIVGVAGIVMLARVGSGQPAAGDGYEMDVLTACVLGGVSLNGGKGRLEKAFVGILIIAILSNGMSMAGMGDFQQRMVKGLVLIFAVVLDSMQYIKVRRKVTGAAAT